MPFMRTMSVEQRWQDLASLLSLPGAPDHFAHPAHPGYPGHGISHSHYEAQRNVLLHNPTLAPPVGDLNSTGPYHNVGECRLKLHGGFTPLLREFLYGLTLINRTNFYSF